MAQGPTLKIKNRLNRVVIALILLGFAVVLVNLFNHAVLKSDFYQEMALDNQMRDITVNGKRGTIYDSNMKAIARSATVWTVFISPNDLNAIKDPEKRELTRRLIAENLSEILEVDSATITEKTYKENYYEVIKKKVEEPQIEEIRAFVADKEITCVHLVEDSKRYYPYNDFASAVIGFTGSDNQGLYGIEAKYDNYLVGTPGRIVAAKNANGTDMPLTYEKMYEAKDGNDLVLTIDYSIQYFLEKALEATVNQHQPAERAAGIVMNVNTGQILAMASEPDFNLNEPYTILDEKLAATLEGLEGDAYTAARSAAWERQWRNKAITELYEPGSVFKVVTAAAALEEKKVSASTGFNCTGSKKVGVHTMGCHVRGGHGSQTFPETIVNSCNPAFIEIGQLLGQNLFTKYVRSFGLANGSKTGIDLPGEQVCQTYSNPDSMSIVDLASCSFGQSNVVTPIQMITIMAAVVNGGNLVTPYVVQKILDQDGNVVKNVEPQIKRQVISEETSAQMCEMLEEVVAANGGGNAYVKGYRIGGKSGTAQKGNDTVNQRYISSFCTFAPVNDPEIAVLIVVDEPNVSNGYYGSVVAGPACASLMADALPYLGYEPQYTEEELAQQEVSVGNYIGMDVLKAQNEATNRQLKAVVKGNGTKVVKQVPERGSTLARQGRVILYTEEDLTEAVTTVPNLVGRTPSEANTILTNLHLNIKLSGASNATGATIFGQSIASGTQVPIGTVVQVECRTSDSDG